jgi:hypothetical protein
MKNLLLIPVALLVAVGCNPAQTPAPVAEAPTSAPPVKLTATQELAKYCRVCVVDKDEKMEEFLPTRLDKTHEGKLYKFCSEPCRKSFDAKPARYALAK